MTGCGTRKRWIDHVQQMQESITASLFRLLILLLILAAIIFAGWNEPLRNRFLSRQEIEAFNPEPAPPPGPVTLPGTP